MAVRKMKGGSGEGISLLLSVLALAAIVAFFALAGRDKFVTGPSATGDNKEVTPAGNVILY